MRVSKSTSTVTARPGDSGAGNATRASARRPTSGTSWNVTTVPARSPRRPHRPAPPPGTGPPAPARRRARAQPLWRGSGSGLRATPGRRDRRRCGRVAHARVFPVVDARLAHVSGDRLLHVPHHAPFQHVDRDRLGQLIVVPAGLELIPVGLALDLEALLEVERHVT